MKKFKKQHQNINIIDVEIENLDNYIKENDINIKDI